MGQELSCCAPEQSKLGGLQDPVLDAGAAHPALAGGAQGSIAMLTGASARSLPPVDEGSEVSTPPATPTRLEADEAAPQTPAKKAPELEGEDLPEPEASPSVLGSESDVGSPGPGPGPPQVGAPEEAPEPPSPPLQQRAQAQAPAKPEPEPEPAAPEVETADEADDEAETGDDTEAEETGDEAEPGAAPRLSLDFLARAATLNFTDSDTDDDDEADVPRTPDRRQARPAAVPMTAPSRLEEAAAALAEATAAPAAAASSTPAAPKPRRTLLSRLRRTRSSRASSGGVVSGGVVSGGVVSGGVVSGGEGSPAAEVESGAEADAETPVED